MDDYLTERFLRLPDGLLPHLGVKGDGDVAPYVLLSGDPGRVEQIKDRLERPHQVGSKRGYLVYTGAYHSIPVTVATSGVGSPSLSIAIEELAVAGGRAFIRVGSCASISPELGVGDVLIASAGVRDEGLSHYYAPAIYPAVAEPDVIHALRTAALALGVTARVGLVRSTDSFYEGERKVETIERWRSLNVLAFEMEASALFVLASVKGLRGGCVLVPGSNLLFGKSTYQGHSLEEYRTGIESAITIALEAVERLHATNA